MGRFSCSLDRVAAEQKGYLPPGIAVLRQGMLRTVCVLPLICTALNSGSYSHKMNAIFYVVLVLPVAGAEPVFRSFAGMPSVKGLQHVTVGFCGCSQHRYQYQ